MFETHLSLAPSHSNVHESPSVGDSLLGAPFWSETRLDFGGGREAEREERASFSFLGARPAIAGFISQSSHDRM